MKTKLFSLLIAICMVLSLIPAAAAAEDTVSPSGIEEYPVLEYGVDLTIYCDDQFYSYVTFTPTVSGNYMFDSLSDGHTEAVLCDAGMSQTLASDSGFRCAQSEHKHWGSTFCIVRWLEAGVTYVLGVRMYSEGEGEVIVRGGCMHNYALTDTEEATCCEDGTYYFTCGNCGRVTTRTIYAYPDFTEEITKEPTCLEEGVLSKTCIECGRVRTEAIPTIHHAYNDALKCIYCGQGVPASSTWSDEYGNSLTWRFHDGLLILTGEGGMPRVKQGIDYWGDYLYTPDTPWMTLPVRELVVGNGITNVSAGAFKGTEELEKVTLPESVSYIGQQAFESCASLKEITFSSGLESIDRQAFRFCSSLTQVQLPDGLKKIGHDSFRGCDLREVVLPAGLEPDLDDAYGSICETFSENPGLTRFVISEENDILATDSQGALYTKDLSELLILPEGFRGTYTLPASVTYFNTYYTFHDCAGLEAIEVEDGNEVYYSVDGILYSAAYDSNYDEELEDWVDVKVGEQLVCCPPAKDLGAFTIDSDVTRLADWAFKNCRGLTELTFPAACGLGKYHLPLGTYLSNCTALQAVWFEEGHPEYVCDDEGVVFNRSEFWEGASERVYGPMESLEYLPAGRTGYYAVPDGVRYLAERSIWNSQLSAIRFPESLEAYGENAMDKGTIGWMLFTGEKPLEACFYDGCESCQEMTAKVYYPGWMDSWKPCALNGSSPGLTYVSYAQGKEPVYVQTPFGDVPGDSFYAAPVAWAVEEGITTGASADSFNPTAQCLRAHVVTFLWRAEGCPEPKSLSNPFEDVKETDFYFKAVLWAVEESITNGSDATHFNPLGVCNRAQVVTFLHRAKGSPVPESVDLPFTDVPEKSWYTAPVAWAVEQGITNGLTATTFGPTAACNRAQVVTFLYRAYVD